MRRTIWEWLGIERTKDKSQIKKAYAKQAKKYHPEEFPEEAQELRKAYKDAMAQASASKAAYDWEENYREQEYAFADPVAYSAPPETDTEGEPKYTYRRPAPPSAPPESDTEAEREYRFHSPKPPPDRMKRIADLKKRMEAIYGSKYRNFVKDWRQAFAICLESEDLKDLQAVWEIFRVIEPMQRLRGATWEAIQEELFRFREDTAPWQLLQERFDEVRRPYVAPGKKAADTSADPSGDTSWFGPEETPPVTPPKKTSWGEIGLIFMGILFLLFLISTIDRAQSSRWQQERQEELRELIAQQVSVEIPPVPISKETFQTVYTKESPWELDLNGDGLPDHIYYDPDKGLFMVELLDISTEAYESYGSLNQYLEENPETENMKILSYLATGE